MDQAKWDAAAKAVAQNPTLSNKALSRSAGVSDHLIAKVRRGMTRTESAAVHLCVMRGTVRRPVRARGLSQGV